MAIFKVMAGSEATVQRHRWTIDLRQRAIEVYRSPEGDQYTEAVVHRKGEVNAQRVNIAIRVNDLFPSTGNASEP